MMIRNLGVGEGNGGQGGSARIPFPGRNTPVPRRLLELAVSQARRQPFSEPIWRDRSDDVRAGALSSPPQKTVPRVGRSPLRAGEGPVPQS